MIRSLSTFLRQVCACTLVATLLWTVLAVKTAFSVSPSSSSFRATTASSSSQSSVRDVRVNNILILDHLNINHEQGRHDWLKAFYFDFLKCVPDPRKAENLERGRNTVWANIGAQQFHLPEGKPHAQVLQGVITLSYPNLDTVRERWTAVAPALVGSQFCMSDAVVGDHVLDVTDPWGNSFRLVAGASTERDRRGQQDGGVSEGLAMRDLTIYTGSQTNFEGIGRFYRDVLGSLAKVEGGQCVVTMGPEQTLTFRKHPENKPSVSHVDLRSDDTVDVPEGSLCYLSNYGPHISIYVADLPATYARVDALGVTYVNPRFKRRAYTLEQAVEQCMFRCLDIVDPENPAHGPILQLEHEIRSVTNPDGTKYKSCPFDEIPDVCI